MKALTVRQPWAWAIIHGGKDVENRTQAWTYRGPLAIHAGLAKPEQHNMASRAHRAAHGSEVPTELVYGGIIGVVDLVDVHHYAGSGPGAIDCCDSPWAEESYLEHGGKTHLDIVHLVLENPRALVYPVPCKGRLGLWEPDQDVIEEVWPRCQACGSVMADSGCRDERTLPIRSDRTGELIKSMTTGWCQETGEWAR